MVCIVMVLAATLDLISVQCDITAEFIHAHILATETIYVHQPCGFHHGNGDEVLHLKQTLYGLKPSHQFFFEYISKRLINSGLTPSKFDPCLFMSTSLIVIVYINNILIYGQHDEEITKLIKQLQKEEVVHHHEGTAKGCLGVDIQQRQPTYPPATRLNKALTPNFPPLQILLRTRLL
jgi:hypothetical protein